MRRFLVALALLTPPAALAYNETIHALVTRRAFAARLAWEEEQLSPPTEQGLAGLRALFHRTAVQLPDAALSARFLARYPSEAAFAAWAFKELFMLDPAAGVHGFDRSGDEQQRRTRAALLEAASRWPDDDGRNRNRYLRDGARAVVRAPDGSPIPYDPATLDLGGLSGTTSQGHAHYALVSSPLSDDPDVLKKDPRRFAVPPTAHGYGADFAQLYTDLALLAASSDLNALEWLSATFAGAAFHHIEDVANQIHTVQVGAFEFFRDAYVQSKLRDVATLGGLLGARRSLRQIGLRLLSNHHLLSEDLFAKRVREALEGRSGEPRVRAAIAGLEEDDPEFARAAQAAVARAGGSRGEFGRAIAQALVEISSGEAADVYRLIYRLSAKSLREGDGHEYDGSRDDPDEWVAQPSEERRAAAAAFYELQGRGLRRAATALRLWQRMFEEAAREQRPALRQRVVQRTLAFLMPYHEAAARRRASYMPAPRPRGQIAWGYPAAALLVLALAALAVRRLRGARASA